MNDENGSAHLSVLVSFVAGGLAGATAALLLAPRSGARTRELIGRRVRDEVDKGRTAGARIAGKGREVLDGASGYIGKQVDEQEQRHERHVAGRKREEAPAL